MLESLKIILEISELQSPKSGRPARHAEQFFSLIASLLNEHSRSLLLLLLLKFWYKFMSKAVHDITIALALVALRRSDVHLVLACHNVERLEESCRRCLSRLVLHQPDAQAGRRIHLILSTDDPTSFLCMPPSTPLCSKIHENLRIVNIVLYV